MAPSPQLLLWNEALAHTFGADELDLAMTGDAQQSRAQVFSGNVLPNGAEVIALAYAGHQFGHFVSQLGDGRAHLLGEVLGRDGQRYDIQLKGSGPTPFSRGGDGRCALGPALREFIMSEALHYLGIPTTRVLAVVSTGERVYRQTPLPGAVVTRVALSHIRVGTFEYFAARADRENLRLLCEYAIRRHFPEIDAESDDLPSRVIAFVAKVRDAQIDLVTDWLRVGFIHGVMNTDNCAVSGQTLDYGPCAMMNTYDPATVFSSIDRQGRYAFGKQPQMAYWNLMALAEALLTLIDKDLDAAAKQVMPVLEGFKPRFERQYHAMLARKLGVADLQDSNPAWLLQLLELMQSAKMDYTNTYLRLQQYRIGKASQADLAPPLQRWVATWDQKLREAAISDVTAADLMTKTNPQVIPRNHRVEAALAAAHGGNLKPLLGFLEVLRRPYCLSAEGRDFQDAPPAGDAGYQTFCGT